MTTAGSSVTGVHFLDESQPRLLSSFNTYLDNINAFCPYLAPCRRISALHNLSLHTDRMPSVQRAIFSLGYLFGEFLVNTRLPTDTYSSLRCFNLLDASHCESPFDFRWAHWYLKSVFSGSSLLFGKFHPNDARYAGIVPPCSFLSIRYAIQKRDDRFLTRFPALLQASHTGDTAALDMIRASLSPSVYAGLGRDLGADSEALLDRIVGLWPDVIASPAFDIARSAGMQLLKR